MEEGNAQTEPYREIFVGGWKQGLAAWTLPQGPGLGVDLSAEFLREFEMRLSE